LLIAGRCRAARPAALKLAPLACCSWWLQLHQALTVLAHWVLGFTDALAVGGGWIAVRGSFFRQMTFRPGC